MKTNDNLFQAGVPPQGTPSEVGTPQKESPIQREAEHNATVIMNIYEKMSLVSSEVRIIGKNMTVGAGSYAYKAVSDQDVILAVNAAERKYGLVSYPHKQELLSHEVRTGQKSTAYEDIIKMTLRIVNIDKPSEFVDIETFGRGLDSGDKGFGKASTYARKYALLNAYKIATGEDPDAEKSPAEGPAKTPDEIKKRVIACAREIGSEYESSLLTHFSVAKLEDLPATAINPIITSLKKKGYWA
jgi:hypothetical protein